MQFTKALWLSWYQFDTIRYALIYHVLYGRCIYTFNCKYTQRYQMSHGIQFCIIFVTFCCGSLSPGEPWHRVYANNEEPYAPVEECTACGLRWLAKQATHTDPKCTHLAWETSGNLMKSGEIQRYDACSLSSPGMRNLMKRQVTD